jgi:hypothetical protein
MEHALLNTAQQPVESVIGTGARLTIETIADFQQRIRLGLNEATTVVLEFDPELELDITALQLFCSACKTAAAEGKRFTYRGQPPKALLELIAAAGAERHEHCINNNSECFRKVGGLEQWQS